LARGLEVLEILAGRPDGVTIVELSELLGLHRAIVGRLTRTLDQYGYVERVDQRRLRLGIHVVELGRSVKADLREAAAGPLSAMADELRATTLLIVRDGDDAVVVSVVEPQHSDLHLAFRLGTRHPLDVGAEGMAILIGCPPRSGERGEVTAGRRSGYVVSTGEVHQGTWGLATPIKMSGRPAEASIGVISQTPLDEAVVAGVMRRGAETIAARLGG
jgi:DNA-binding IclR family transcriptional regulator